MQPTYVNMTELASMAASKITNNSQQQQQLPIQQQLQQQQQPNSPVLSIASSLISSDSSATNQQTSPGSGSQTPQTLTSPHTPSLLASGGGGSSLDEDITQTDELINEKINILSPENDPKCKGSVLEKTSMFEKLEVFNNNLVAMPRSESIYGRKNEEIYKSAGTLDRDSGKFFIIYFIACTIAWFWV